MPYSGSYFLFTLEKYRDILRLYLTPRPYGIDPLAPCGTLLLCNLVYLSDMKKIDGPRQEGNFVNPSET